MSDTHESNEVRAAIDPVWFNTHWVTSALGLYEGVSKHADELSANNYATFFGLTQKFALESAAMGLCKLYDISNPAYQKDTVPALLSYSKAHATTSYLRRLTVEKLTAVGISELCAIQFLTDLERDFESTKPLFFTAIEGQLPDKNTDAALGRLLTYRNKVGAHQQRLDDELQQQLKSLPSLYDMERLNSWAINLCILSTSLLTNVTLLPSGTSARIAALNVAAKLLDKKFSSHDERQSFYSRI